MQLMNGQYFIYFYYNKDDTLLYIGKAIDVWARWKGHNDPWKNEVCKIGVLECPDRAAMDVLESYFITKMPTKYNKAGLAHGYTGLEIAGLGTPILYSLDEFRERYRPVPQMVQPPKEVLPPKLVNTAKRTSKRMQFHEKLLDVGFSILEVDKTINLLDVNLLQLDLDYVCFKYQNVYLMPRVTPLKKIIANENRPKATRRTNETLLVIKEYLSSPTFSKREENDGVHHTFKFCGSYDDTIHITKDIMAFSSLYSIKKVSYNGRKEDIAHIGYNIFGCIGCEWLHSDTYLIDIHFTKDHFKMLQPEINESSLVYDFEKILEVFPD